MNSYDTAYALAREMRESEVYQSYVAAKEKAFEKELNRDLYKQFVQVSREVQAAQFAGQPVSEELQTRFGQLMGVLSLNADVTAFMMTEHRLNQMMSDIFKILADAVDLDLGFLNA
jgi:cell fate (sporulation/competence/biofilm development) regulator YlbF (YheA/YmcA/DUF963 family)